MPIRSLKRNYAGGSTARRRKAMNTTTLQSPRPLPIFSTNASFSQRKKTPLRTPRPPKPPIKSCPPVSRIFRSPDSLNQPHIVSFTSKRDESTFRHLPGHNSSFYYILYTVVRSPLYDVTSRQLYFEQVK